MQQQSVYREYSLTCLPNGRIAIGCDPDASKVVVVDAIFKKLTTAIFMDIYATSQSIVNITFNDRRICTRLDLEPSNTIVMYIVAIEIALNKQPNYKFRVCQFHSILAILF